MMDQSNAGQSDLFIIKDVPSLFVRCIDVFSEPHILVEVIAHYFGATSAVFWRRDKFTSTEFFAEGIYNRPELMKLKEKHRAYFLLGEENIIFRDDVSGEGVIVGSIFEYPFGEKWTKKSYTSDLVGLGIKIAAICPIEDIRNSPFGAISLYFKDNIDDNEEFRQEFQSAGRLLYSILVNVVGEIDRVSTDQAKLGHEILSQIRNLRQLLGKIEGDITHIVKDGDIIQRYIQDAKISTELISSLAKERSFRMALSIGKKGAIFLDLRDQFNASIQPVIQSVSKKNAVLLPAQTNTSGRIFVRMAPTHLTDMLTNFAQNAVKYCIKGGYIRSSFNYAYETRGLRFTISNLGNGIPDDERALIWEPSYRSRKARSSGVGGEGLGLNIVADICNLYSMEYGYVESPTSRKGLTVSTFWVSFPAEMVRLRPDND